LKRGFLEIIAEMRMTLLIDLENKKRINRKDLKKGQKNQLKHPAIAGYHERRADRKAR
jgi:hypothetical protein